MKKKIDTDLHWDLHSKTDPYWSVVTNEDFKDANLDEKKKEEFFKGGENYINSIHEVIKQSIDSGIEIKTALDFGCGVGRLLLPLAQKGYKVTGIDISDNMLKICEENLKNKNIKDYALFKSDDNLSAIKEKFDLVHTFIVLQHIPVERGIKIISRLLDSISDNGIGVIHLTYYPIHPTSLIKVLRFAIKDFYLKSNTIRNLYQSVTNKEIQIPMMMNDYNLNEVFWELQKREFNNIHMRFTDHGKKGILIFCQKSKTIAHPNSY